jgi:anti-anti-sigma factor
MHHEPRELITSQLVGSISLSPGDGTAMNPLVTMLQCRRVVVVRCRGELDLSSMSELQAGLAQVPAPAPPAEDPRQEGRHDLVSGSASSASGPSQAPAAATGVVDAVVVDLAEVTFMDCAALRQLVALSERCTRQRARFLLSGPTAIVSRLLNALRLDRVFVVTRTLREAIALAETWADLGGLPVTVVVEPAGDTRPTIPAPAAHRDSTPDLRPPVTPPPFSRPPVSRPSSARPDDNDLRGRRWMI